MRTKRNPLKLFIFAIFIFYSKKKKIVLSRVLTNANMIQAAFLRILITNQFFLIHCIHVESRAKTKEEKKIDIEMNMEKYVNQSIQ